MNLTMAADGELPDPAGSRPRPAALRDDDEAMALEALGQHRQRLDLAAAHAAIARCAAAVSSTMSPPFQATSTPPGTSSGKASSTSSSSPPTARTVTAGHRSRWRGSRASSSDRAATTATRAASPVASTAASRNAAFLPTDSTRADRSTGRTAASGIPGKPPPLPRSRNAPTLAPLIRRACRTGAPRGCRRRGGSRSTPDRGSRSG